MALNVFTIRGYGSYSNWARFLVRTILSKAALIREIGGWDPDAITEDTAVSFDILTRGQLIALAPQAEAYQQEPSNYRYI